MQHCLCVSLNRFRYFDIELRLVTNRHRTIAYRASIASRGNKIVSFGHEIIKTVVCWHFIDFDVCRMSGESRRKRALITAVAADVEVAMEMITSEPQTAWRL